MAYDLDEQEQLAALKAWWNRYGTLLLLLTTVVLGTMAAINGWHWWQASQSREAAVWFERAQQASENNDLPLQKSATAKLISDYRRTAYAPRAALLTAASLVRTKAYKAAEGQLQWVIDHARDTSLVQVAKLNLAAVLLDQKQYDAALKQVQPIPSGAFASLFAERQGDIYLAKGLKPEAIKAYQTSLKESPEQFALRASIELKLESLGAPTPDTLISQKN